MPAAVHSRARARDDGHVRATGIHENGAVTTVAEAYLSLLRDRGVSRLFVNAGTDFAPFVEAYARQKQSGLDFPELVICAHENLAISMAHGAYLGDGRVQAVMVHTSVGTANAVCGMFNAATDRVPILLAAGRTPLFEDSVLGSRDGGIHWAQEMYDQASMVREFVKWDYELRDGVQVAAVLDRAIDIAMAAPRGPVYLSLPREVLARDASGAVPARGCSDPDRRRTGRRGGRTARGPAGRRAVPGLRHGRVGNRPRHGGPARAAVRRVLDRRPGVQAALLQREHQPPAARRLRPGRGGTGGRRPVLP